MSGAPNSIILVSDGIVAWGLRVEGEIPIPADVIDGTPPMECPYGYRFPGRRCPLVGKPSHDAPAPLRYVNFRVPVQMEYFEEEEEDGIHCELTITGGDSRFLLRTVLSDTHRHIVFTVVSVS